MESNLTIGQLVVEKPIAAKVLHKYNMDFCCGGHKSLADTCSKKGIDMDNLIQEIEAEQNRTIDSTDWNTENIEDLIDHILVTYHEPLKIELPRIIELAEKVERVHVDKQACPNGLANHLELVRDAVMDHLYKEEQILFPLIRSGRGQYAYMPIQMMIKEHDDHGENLSKIRSMTGHFTVPQYACATWRELYRSLEQLEIDLMVHIHLENNILFPRVLAH